MFARLVRHLRQQYAGFLALFIALGGVSYAAVTLPASSVGSKQIKRGAVKNVDLAGSAVTSAKVKDGSLLATDFKPGQLVAGAPGPQGLQGPKGDPGINGTNGTNGANGTNGTNGADGADATKLWGVINADGSTARDSGVFESALLANGGIYEVAFDRSVRDCAYLATIGSPGEDTASAGMISVARRSTNQNSVYVKTYDSTGADAQMPFHIAVFC